jgi:carbonic anhydrase
MRLASGGFFSLKYDDFANQRQGKMTSTTGITTEELFQRNRDWAASMIEKKPDFFQSLVAQQTPEYLWIGCSDSRVPANELLGMAPGELFVHRNIANVVVSSDLNCLSVLQFSVEVLKVKHIIVCGHYGCGGVNAARTGARVGLADNWLRHVRDVHDKHEQYLGNVAGAAATDRLVELNAAEQVINVAQTTVVRDAWERGQDLTIHGWVYGIHDGLLRDLGITVSNADEIQPKLDKILARYLEAGA